MTGRPGMRAELLLFLAFQGLGAAQAGTDVPSDSLTTMATGTFARIPAGPRWSFASSIYAYFVPEDRDYVQPTVVADRDRLHLEARWNYEDFEAASMWVGYNTSIDGPLWMEATPMLGGVFGNTQGVAPGLHASVGWLILEWYVEGEYVFDLDESSNSYLYAWSELTVAPDSWYRLGLVGQRTRAYDAGRDVQRGFLAAVSIGRVEVAGHVFNPDDDRPTTVLAATVGF